MYKSAVAAITMTAAALLLAATPAIADFDYDGPTFSVCDGGVTKLIKMGAPMVVAFVSDGCGTFDDESRSYLMN